MRIKYIDALRGFTMFLVVFMHVMTLSFGVEVSVLGFVFKLIRMPMFFFISGYIGYKALGEFTNKGTWNLLRRKAFVQLVPTTIFFILYHLCTGGNPLLFFISHGLEGYWFTLVLFELFLIYYLTSFAFARAGGGKTQDTFLLVMIITMWMVGIYFGKILHTGPHFIQLFSLQNTFSYMPFFFTGILLRKHWEGKSRIIENQVFFTACVVMFLLGILIISLIDVKSINVILFYFVTALFLPLLGVFSLFGIFQHSADYFEKDGYISRVMQFTGRRTLDIYLLHYFILPDLTAYKDFFTQGGKEFILGEVFVMGAVAIGIIMLCLLFSNCMRKSEILAKYMFGILPKKKVDNIIEK